MQLGKGNWERTIESLRSTDYALVLLVVVLLFRLGGFWLGVDKFFLSFSTRTTGLLADEKREVIGSPAANMLGKKDVKWSICSDHQWKWRHEMTRLDYSTRSDRLDEKKGLADQWWAKHYTEWTDHVCMGWSWPPAGRWRDQSSLGRVKREPSACTHRQTIEQTFHGFLSVIVCALWSRLQTHTVKVNCMCL